MKVDITVNGRARTIDAAPNLLLVQAIRENLNHRLPIERKAEA